jgi:hypothetical protein
VAEEEVAKEEVELLAKLVLVVAVVPQKAVA